MPVMLSRDFGSEVTPGSSFVVFDVLLGLSLFFTSCTYFSALFSKSIVRMMTWFALIISCWLSCISFLLLVGHQVGGDPSFSLCLFQAGMIYAAPPSAAAAALAFVIEIYLRLTTFMTQTLVNNRIITSLLFLPAVTHQVVFWIAIFTGLSKQEAVQPNPQNMFCRIDAELPPAVTGVTVITFVVIMIMVELYTIYYLWRRRTVFREARRHGVGPIFPFKLFIRVGIYTLVAMILISVDVVINFGPTKESTPALDITAVIPLSIALVFGTQEDIVHMYMFWKKKSPSSTTHLNIQVDIEQQEDGQLKADGFSPSNMNYTCSAV
ncbi:hypothetical protein BDP27DRAFT_1350674 [Rhodocollybia butyracea]|uniref:Uncharacterized protein n=1 Tax=Rhodocollybia butyracea TaxID=206335 RepID=A0A9P5P693_9AGAR|nr:hypothetical protein BDP27DRAFT_1350674 [Rhodocollybia butyracea]